MAGADTHLSQAWRIPSWQPAGLILLAAALLAYDIYGSPGLGPLLATAVIAAAALVGAAVAMRSLLVADEDGIWVRSLFRTTLVDWDDITDIDVVHVRGTTYTVRITRRNGTVVDVPPTLLQPTLPTGARKAHAAVGTVARRLVELAADKRG
jgi:hypothetical protein